MLTDLTVTTSHHFRVIEQLRQIIVTALLGNQVPGKSQSNNSGSDKRELYTIAQRRRWFSRKYYASVMNLKEFLEENIGATFTGLISDFARRCNNRH